MTASGRIGRSRSHHNVPRKRPTLSPKPPPLRVPPPVWRDPWAWAAVAPVVLLIWRAWGAPLGEPFADDFDFLHHAMFGGAMRWLDGGGATVYWRPLSRQLYFDLLGPLTLTHPRMVAGLHAMVLVLVAALVYRALRVRWGGAWSAAAASFALIAEANRSLLLWP